MLGYSFDDSTNDNPLDPLKLGAKPKPATPDVGATSPGINPGAQPITPGQTPGIVPPGTTSQAPGAQPADSSLPGLSGVSGISSLGGPQSTAGPTVPGSEPPPQPQTAGRTVKPTGFSQPISDLAKQTQALSQVMDPAERARQEDQIARNVAAALQASGHKVTWKGEQLMVDGRPYVIGNGSTPEADAVATGQTPGINPGAQAAQPATADRTGTPPAAGQPATANIDPNQAAADLTAYFRNKFQREITPQEIAGLQQNLGWSPGMPVTQAIMDRAKQLIDAYTGDPNNPGEIPGGGGGPEEPPLVGTAEWRSQWEGYNPGDVPMDDLEGFDQNAMMARLGGALQPGSASSDPATEALVNSLLANPETFDAKTIAQMKAKEKDQYAEMGAMDDAALRDFGYETGIADSNWLKSERNAAGRERDRAIVGSARDLDIMAKERSMEDRYKAAGLGMEFSDRRFAQALSSKQEQRQAVALAADSSLRASALKGDRLALREQINAKAAELGLDADKMQLQYTLGMMDDLTKRYGIDVGKDIDLRKLASQDRQFNEDLALRFEQLRFQYEELAKRDEWAQLNAGVQLAGYGYSGTGDESAEDTAWRRSKGVPV